MRCWSLPVLLAGVAFPHLVEAGQLERLESGTFSRAYLVHAPDFQAETAASESAGPEHFVAIDSTSVDLEPSIATSTSWLDSKVSRGGVRAAGGATSIVYVPEEDRRAETPADSFFELHFQADDADPFRLKGRVDALAFGAEAFAAVEIVDLEDGDVVFEAQAGPGRYQLFDREGALAAGRYRLTAFALSYGEVAGELRQPDGDLPQPASLASFEAVLQLPEADPRAAAAVALAVLAACATVRSRSQT